MDSVGAKVIQVRMVGGEWIHEMFLRLELNEQLDMVCDGDRVIKDIQKHALAFVLKKLSKVFGDTVTGLISYKRGLYIGS